MVLEAMPGQMGKIVVAVSTELNRFNVRLDGSLIA